MIRRRLFGFRTAACLILTVALAATACGGDGDGTNGSGGGGAPTDMLAGADEVIRVAETGFGVRRIAEGPGYQVDSLDHGYVIENVSDQVALGVRVEVVALDQAGNPIEGLHLEGTSAFGVVLPGQRLGAGGSTRLDDGEVVSGIDVRVTMIVALDTPDGRNHREPPGPYAEMEVGQPTPQPERGGDEYTWFTAPVTNTYDIAVMPTLKSVLRGPDGSIVGGGDSGDPTTELPAGATGPVEFRQSSGSPELDGATVEYYPVPELSLPLTTESVWIDP